MDLFLIRVLQVSLASKGSPALFFDGTLWSRKVFCPFNMSHQTVFCLSLRLENHRVECAHCSFTHKHFALFTFAEGLLTFFSEQKTISSN